MTSIKLGRSNSYFSKFKELVAYVANPEMEISNNLSGKEKLKEIVSFYVILLLISLPLIALINIIFKINNPTAEDFSKSYHPLIVLSVGAFLVPLIEEAIFRLSIIFKPIFLSISITLLTLNIYSEILDVGILNMDDTTLFRYTVSLIIGALTFYISKKHRVILKRFWRKNFRWIYYFSAIAFGLFHFSNFDLVLKSMFFIPLFTLPQTFGGLFFGYIRIKHGFLYAFGFHSLNNLVALSIALLV